MMAEFHANSMSIIVQASLSATVLLLNIFVVFFFLYKRIFRKEIVGTIFLCVADGIFQIAHTTAFTRKTVIFMFFDTTQQTSNWECFKNIYPIILQFAYPHTGFADLLFSAEKMFMIVAPIYYSRLRLKHIFWVFVAGTFVIFCRTVYIGVAWSRTEPYSVGILCNSEHIPVQFQVPSVFARLVLVSSSVVVFLPVLFKVSQMRRQYAVERKEFDSSRIRAAFHAGLLILIVFFCIVVPDLIRIFFHDIFIIYQNLFFNLGMVKPFANTIFALSVFKGFRNGNLKRDKKNGITTY